MSLEENKAIIHKMFEAFNKQDLALLNELIATDYVDHPRQLRGLESYKQFLTMIFNVFPDLHETIEDIIAARARSLPGYQFTLQVYSDATFNLGAGKRS